MDKSPLQPDLPAIWIDTSTDIHLQAQTRVKRPSRHWIAFRSPAAALHRFPVPLSLNLDRTNRRCRYSKGTAHPPLGENLNSTTASPLPTTRSSSHRSSSNVNRTPSDAVLCQLIITATLIRASSRHLQAPRPPSTPWNGPQIGRDCSGQA